MRNGGRPLQSVLMQGVLLLAPLGLAACGGGTSDTAPIACPRPTIPHEAADLTRYRPGPIRDLTTLEFDARLNGLSGGCRIGRRGNSVDLQIIPSLVVDRGPAATGRSVAVPWTIAVLDPDNEPLAPPQRFTTTVVFGANETRASVNGQSVTINLPVSESRRANDYRVMVFLQLEQEELDQNRRRGPR